MYVMQYEVLSRIDVAPPAYFVSSFVVVYGLIFIYSYLRRKRDTKKELATG
mgnify:CR=1 FL=1